MINSNFKKIHLIGIGGVSMSGLAQILHADGFTVSGSDRTISKNTNLLIKKGITVFPTHSFENITDDLNLLIINSAIKNDNPEVLSAKEKNIPIISRAEALGEVMDSYDHPICIAGTHGKTTTTSIIAEILIKGGLEPTITLGGDLPSIGGNLLLGGTKFFLAEACEYSNSFLSFKQKTGVILNVEHDHIDFFENLDEVLSSFNNFAKNIPTDGTLLINSSIIGFDKIIAGITCKIITFGSENSDFTYEVLKTNNKGYSTFNIIHKNEILCTTSICMPGDYNILNALASFAIGYSLNIPAKNMEGAINEYKGLRRRYEFKGYYKNIPIVDDYAHHPTEIKELLKAVRKGSYDKVYGIFHPHTYTRTKGFLKEFSESFNLCDKVIIKEIYSAREKNIYNISSRDLCKEINKFAKKEIAIFFKHDEDILNFIKNNATPNDIILTIGAGESHLLGEELLKEN